MTDKLAIHCGMPDERRRLQNALGYDIPIFSGEDKFHLSERVPPNCKLIVSMGVAGGLSAPWKVGEIMTATTLVSQRGTKTTLDFALISRIVASGNDVGVKINPVPWYSSGLMDEADTASQRAALYAKYGAQVIDDESRFTSAFAQERNIPLLIIRPLSDDWTETLPLEARGKIMNADGSENISYLLHTLRIGDVPQLLRVAQDYETSLKALFIAAKVLKAVLLEIVR